MSWKESVTGRSLRRLLAIFLCGGIAAVSAYVANLSSEQLLVFIPVITAGLAFLDKVIREWSESPA